MSAREKVWWVEAAVIEQKLFTGKFTFEEYAHAKQAHKFRYPGDKK